MGFFADVFDAVKENVKNSQARVTTNLFPLSNQKPYSKKPFDFETKEARRKTFLNFMTHSCNALFVPVELLWFMLHMHVMQPSGLEHGFCSLKKTVKKIRIRTSGPCRNLL